MTALLPLPSCFHTSTRTIGGGVGDWMLTVSRLSFLGRNRALKSPPTSLRMGSLGVRWCWPMQYTCRKNDLITGQCGKHPWHSGRPSG